MSAQRRGGGGSRGRSQGSSSRGGGRQGSGRGGGQGHGGHGRRRGRDDRDEQPPPRTEPGPYEAPPPRPRPAELQPTDQTFRGLNLFPFQQQALEAISRGDSVLVAAPTGAGKTLVADYAIEQAFRAGWRVVYTAPIKALSNQKFRDFRAQFGEQVGIMTGDVTIQPDGDLLVMTTEVFRNTLFESPERFRDFRFVVHDEIHYLDDPDRGTVWEESIIHAPEQMRLVGLSATIPNVHEFAGWIRTLRNEDVTVVEMKQRPVPLDHRVWIPDFGPLPEPDALKILNEPLNRRRNMRRERDPGRVLDWLTEQKLLPALVFCFSRKDCELHALANRRRGLLNDAEVQRMTTLFDDLALRFECKDTPGLRTLRELAVSGVGYHHAGMLPVHKEIVERLFTSGMIKVIFATETFALGINMPARTVVFVSLRKFDGEKVDYMMCRSYGQMAGRAGRQGMDDHGLVVSMVDPTRDRSGGVRRVLSGNIEPVRSRWNPDYSTLLALYQVMGDRVLETYQKSFARYQRSRRQHTPDTVSQEERVLKARLHLLQRTGYIEDAQVTPKGKFVARVNGYDIQAGEWLDAGLFDRVDSRRMAAMLLAATYEPRPRDTWSQPADRKGGPLRKEAWESIVAWRDKEWRAGLTDLTQEPHFGLTAALELWILGRPLAELHEVTSARDGDIVRHFRLLLQFVRQVDKALPDDAHTTRRKLREIQKWIDRDEVDAKRQLEQGQDPLDEVGDIEDLIEPLSFEVAATDDADGVAEEPLPEPELPDDVEPEPEDEDDFGVGLL